MASTQTTIMGLGYNVLLSNASPGGYQHLVTPLDTNIYKESQRIHFTYYLLLFMRG